MDVVDYGCLNLILEEELAMQVQISLKPEDTCTHKEIIITSQKAHSLLISINMVLSFELLPESYFVSFESLWLAWMGM